MQPSCVFCKIIAKQLPAQVIEETPDILVVKDIAPKAPVHWLIIPKDHIASLHDIAQKDADVAAGLLLMAQKLSDRLPGSKAFRLVANNGHDAGQRVFHLHFHFLAGSTMEF